MFDGLLCSFSNYFGFLWHFNVQVFIHPNQLRSLVVSFTVRLQAILRMATAQANH